MPGFCFAYRPQLPSPAQRQQQFSSAGLRFALLSVLDHPPTPTLSGIVVLYSLGTEFTINNLMKVEVLSYDILQPHPQLRNTYPQYFFPVTMIFIFNFLTQKSVSTVFEKSQFISINWFQKYLPILFQMFSQFPRSISFNFLSILNQKIFLLFFLIFF